MNPKDADGTYEELCITINSEGFSVSKHNKYPKCSPLFCSNSSISPHTHLPFQHSKMGASILVITVDLKCCRCRAKITKVLDCLKAEYCIEKTEFEDKDDKVIVRGKFDAGNLRNKIYCKAGGKVVKEIKIVDAWPPPKAPEKKKDEKPVCKLVPFPVPYPAPPPACGGAQGSPPWCCPPNQQCYYCCPAPPPPPPKPKPCECTHCHGGGCNKPVPPCGGGCSSDGGACGASKPPPAIWPPQPSFYYYPPPCGGYKFACEENSDVCAIM